MTELYKIEKYFLDEDEFIEEIKRKHGIYILLSDRSRMIQTPIMSSRNNYCMKYDKSPENIIISSDLFFILIDSPSFSIAPTHQSTNKLIFGGVLTGINVYYHFFDIPKEIYLLSDSITDPVKYIKNNQRIKKLERVLR